MSSDEPKITPIVRHGITISADDINRLMLKPYFASGFVRSCISCDHFIEKTEQCIKYGARPPARVIAFSCPSWSDDNDIPF